MKWLEMLDVKYPPVDEHLTSLIKTMRAVMRIHICLAWALCFPLSLIWSTIASAQQVEPQVPPSDSSGPNESGRAHTNYDFLGGEAQKQAQTQALIQSSLVPLDAVILSKPTASQLQIVRPSSDSANISVSEKFARLALAANVAPPAGAELRAHTDYEFLAAADSPGIPIGSFKYNTPAEIRARYSVPSTGGGGVIIVVDAYLYQTVESDLDVFSKQFNLPACNVTNGCLQVIKTADAIKSDTDPSVPDCGWSGEAAVDLQWAHAIAPRAKLVLVEAISSKVKDMMDAVEKANAVAAKAGGGIVSMSWSYGETSEERNYDAIFNHRTILYFAASGDSDRVEYPAASPYVIGVGGTEVLRSANGQIVIERGWSYAGAGNSIYEPRPAFQNGVENITDAGRVTPDIAGPAGVDAELQNGVPVFEGTTCSLYKPGWYAVGGTSVATPIIAATATYTHPHGGDTSTALANIYRQRTDKTVIRDIVTGQAGSYLCQVGYDKCSGVGVPVGVKFADALSHSQ